MQNVLVPSGTRPGTFFTNQYLQVNTERVGTFTAVSPLRMDIDRPGTYRVFDSIVHQPRRDPLVSHRSVRRTYELVSRDGGRIAALTGVRGASLHQSAAATLKRGGQMVVTDTGQEVDWLTARIRCGYEVEGYGSWGLGVYLPSMPTEQWDGETRRWDVQMLDVATVLAEGGVGSGYSLPAGQNVTSAIRDLIASAGELPAAITDSDKTLANARVWEPGTPILTIINELLDSIGYFSLTTDGDGRLTAEPYVRPAARPIVHEFIDGETCIYRPDLSRELDLYNVPNHVVAVVEGSGDVLGMFVEAFNANPASPFSVANRGRTITRKIEPDATDLDALATIASRALIEATTPTSKIVIEALPMPVEVNDAVRFRSTAAGVDGRHVVSRIEYGAADTDLARYTLLEVVDL